MTRTAKRLPMIDRIRRAARTVRRCYRICRRHSARFDVRCWLDSCFAWGWLDH